MLKLKNRNIIIFFALVIILIIAVVLTFNFHYSTTSQTVTENSEPVVLAQNLDVPWAIDFLPNGTMIFTERVGRVDILVNNTTVETVGTINVIQSNGTESGLHGIAVDPNFNENHYIYVDYTYGSNYTNRISRFVLSNGMISNETVLLDNIPGSYNHDGGRLKFGPDGKLYATTGDAYNNNSAQDINSLSGKILRLNPNGSIPSDNPFGNYVYSYGLRDSEGITWNPSNGIMYDSDNGNIMDDEINIIVKGGNYGWPILQGNESAPGYISPIDVYTNFTLAPSGITYYQNHLYVAGLQGQQIRVLNLSSDGKTVTSESEILTNYGRLREVVAYDGYLYITTSNEDGRGTPQSGDDKIIRIKV